MSDTNERSVASAGSVQPLAWGVMPGDNLPLWRCSSRLQAERVVAWLRKQRPASTPQAVPLVDGRHATALTDAERGAIDKAAHAAAQLYVGPDGVALAATLRGLLDRMG